MAISAGPAGARPSSAANHIGPAAPSRPVEATWVVFPSAPVTFNSPWSARLTSTIRGSPARRAADIGELVGVDARDERVPGLAVAFGPLTRPSRLVPTTSEPTTALVVATSATRVATAGRRCFPCPSSMARREPVIGTGRSLSAVANRVANAGRSLTRLGAGRSHLQIAVAVAAPTSSEAAPRPMTRTIEFGVEAHGRVGTPRHAQRQQRRQSDGQSEAADHAGEHPGAKHRVAAPHRSPRVRPIAASTSLSAARPARWRATAWAITSSPTAATTPPATSEPAPLQVGCPLGGAEQVGGGTDVSVDDRRQVRDHGGDVVTVAQV